MQRISQHSNPSKVSRPSHHNHSAPEIHKIHLHGPLPGTLRLEDNKEIMGGIWQVRSLWEDTELRGKVLLLQTTMPKFKGVIFTHHIPSVSQHQSLKFRHTSKSVIQHHYPPQKNNMSPEKGTILKGKFIFQPSILREYVSFQGVVVWQKFGGLSEEFHFLHWLTIKEDVH